MMEIIHLQDAFSCFPILAQFQTGFLSLFSREGERASLVSSFLTYLSPFLEAKYDKKYMNEVWGASSDVHC